MQKYKKEEIIEFNEKAFTALLNIINNKPVGDVPGIIDCCALVTT